MLAPLLFLPMLGFPVLLIALPVLAQHSGLVARRTERLRRAGRSHGAREWLKSLRTLHLPPDSWRSGEFESGRGDELRRRHYVK
jgi:hypothetical protein